MSEPRRYETVYASPRRQRLEDRMALLRWRIWQLRQPALRGVAPILIGPGASIAVRGSGSVECGRRVRARADLTLAVQGTLTIGDGVFLGRGASITCFDRVSIGAGTRLAERVSIHDENHVLEPLSDGRGRSREYLVDPVIIGERVWLAAGVVVLPGVSIGDDTVVGAGSVVTSDLPAGVIALGAPATVRRELAP